jgi:hypothetical protein
MFEVVTIGKRDKEMKAEKYVTSHNDNAKAESV